MRLLLDTHVLIWWDSKPEKLPADIIALLSQPDTERFISVVSLWEIQIKHQLGKLTLAKLLSEIYESQRHNQTSVLSVEPDHVFYLGSLPLHYKDPFDRLLIAQALVEGLTLLSKDEKFKLYGVPLLSF